MSATGSDASILPQEYQTLFSSFRPSDEEERRVFNEMLATVRFEYGKIASPRKKRQRRKEKNTPGGSKSYVDPDEPKKEEKTMLERVANKLRNPLELPHVCCSKHCCSDNRFSSNIVKYRIAGDAALQPDERRSRIQAIVSQCRVKPGQNRQEFQYKVPIPGGHLPVCRNFFLFYYNIALSTLNRMQSSVKGISGMIREEKVHGNAGRRKPGKGRQDCAEWMRMLFDDVAEPKPNHVVVRDGVHRTKEFLPSGIFGTLDSVFNYYKSAFAGNDETPVSYMTFRRAWLQHHFQVRLEDFPKV
jgi:hypothetical protein